jgi:site-specific recombinase XerD
MPPPVQQEGFPTRDEIAAFRSYLEGVAPRVVMARYGTPQPAGGALRSLASIRRRLVAAARLRHLDDGAQLLLLAKPGHLTPSASRRLQVVLTQLPSLRVPEPTLADPLAHWLKPRSAHTLAAAGITTLAAVALRRSQRRTWWQKIPGFGLRAASAVEDFFAAHEHLLETAQQALSAQDGQNATVAGTAVVPWEALQLPRDLDGSRGKLRAPQRACLLEARNDYEAVQAWLSLQESAATQRAYRKEAERLLLWALIEQSKPLSSLTTEDAIAYRHFLRHPAPAARWVGPTTRRQSKEWRPFQRGVSVRSAAYALSVLSALYRWLTEQRYLTGNPFAGITAKVVRSAKAGGSASSEFIAPSERAFTSREWAGLLRWADSAVKTLGWTTDAARRLQFVLRFAHATGLRISELVHARVRDIKTPHPPQRWLMVRGKGNKRAPVALPPTAWQALSEEMHRRGYGKRFGAWPAQLPLIAAFALNGQDTQDSDAGISSGRLWAILRKFFDQVADHVETGQPQLAAKLRVATPHWLRHTHASHALEGGADLPTVRDNLRHASLTTTSGYVHVDEVRRSRQLSRVFGRAKNRKEPARGAGGRA